ncbi:YopX family protein [Clostridium sp. Ade.TY]|uniref:YopX family protein n=1 Tax=Clostridium sp. Ade.TY TaxID=1391647 RepID=UPI0003FE1687|nr:YopX family protein [Clostridium sp. Ade.TY]
MREIKFRIWDKTSNHMLYQDDFERVEIDTKNKIVITIADVEINKSHYALDYEDGIEAEIMQYTGLKDEHGKEIYEGDILRCKCKKRGYEYFKKDEEIFEYKNNLIEWWQSSCNLGYRLRNAKGNTMMIKPSCLKAMEVEVIGNIYENPELLEVEE